MFSLHINLPLVTVLIIFLLKFGYGSTALNQESSQKTPFNLKSSFRVIEIPVDDVKKPLLSIVEISIKDEEQFNKGLCYFKQKNLNKAIKYWTLSADQGNPMAQYNLAKCYREGLGVIQDLDQAADLYLESAEGGLAEAQFFVGSMYYNEYNLHDAKRWWKKAANQGHRYAQQNLCFLKKNQKKNRNYRTILLKKRFENHKNKILKQLYFDVLQELKSYHFEKDVKPTTKDISFENINLCARH